MIKAFLFDLDDTLTHVTDIHQYSYGSHRSLQKLLKQNGSIACPDQDTYRADHLEMWRSGQCHFTGIAQRYGVDRAQFFQGHHDLIDESFVVHDVESAEALDSLKGRALIYTDGARSWAARRSEMIGIDLPIQARDDHPDIFERKAHSLIRLSMALDGLRRITGEDLRPDEVLMVDDSTSVLGFVRSHGLKTAFCHYGTPGRTGTGGFDYEVQHVGTFLQEQGFVPSLPIVNPAFKAEAQPK